MKIAEGVEVLALATEFMEKRNTVNPTLIWDSETVILVDAGFPGQFQSILEAMDKAGVPFGSLKKVVITHQDIDHIGCLPNILQASDHKIEIIAHPEEKPYIEGTKPLLKMNPERIKRMIEFLPEEQGQQVAQQFNNPPKAIVDRTVADGEILPYCGGITIIHTPGHTTGHICLYLNRSRTLITGDALVVADGQLLGPRPQASYDIEEAEKSLKKLTKFDIKTVVCYHGGVFKNNANRRIAELAILLQQNNN